MLEIVAPAEMPGPTTDCPTARLLVEATVTAALPAEVLEARIAPEVRLTFEPGREALLALKARVPALTLMAPLKALLCPPMPSTPARVFMIGPLLRPAWMASPIWL